MTKANGSEHSIDGKKYAAEVHFVSHSDAYQNIEEASQKDRGVAVTTLFLEFCV